jgi:hypothetical protein
MYDGLRGLLYRVHDNDVLFICKSTTNDEYEYGPLHDVMQRLCRYVQNGIYDDVPWKRICKADV